jgi:hypothetical protein
MMSKSPSATARATSGAVSRSNPRILQAHPNFSETLLGVPFQKGRALVEDPELARYLVREYGIKDVTHELRPDLPRLDVEL